MNPMTTRTHAQTQASKANGSRSEGPISTSGKAISSVNAVRHGVRAQRVLLEGERIEDYLAEAELWANSLEPQTDAELEVVHDIVDVRVRVGRLDLAEKSRIDKATKRDLSQNQEQQRLKLTQNALTLLNAMKMAIDQARTTKATQFEALFPAVRSVVELGKQVQAQHSSLIEGLLQLEDAVEDLFIFTGSEWPSEIFNAISRFIDLLSVDLHRRAEVDMQVVNEIEIDAAMVAVPTNDAEGRRLEGYRRQLERRLQAHLDLLEQLRRLRPGGGSSGSFVRPLHINLRSAPGPQALAHG